MAAIHPAVDPARTPNSNQQLSDTRYTRRNARPTSQKLAMVVRQEAKAGNAASGPEPAKSARLVTNPQTNTVSAIRKLRGNRCTRAAIVLRPPDIADSAAATRSPSRW